MPLFIFPPRSFLFQWLLTLALQRFPLCKIAKRNGWARFSDSQAVLQPCHPQLTHPVLVFVGFHFLQLEFYYFESPPTPHLFDLA